ncbi:hypothetical protein QCA50_003641 [Cerrena zonata]|uniref:NAD(P)-binding domain-containing protein n=1 Tax=Cerrena zonata TaxID=2478898 RepID=A0AAW0GLG2_9APHY
MRAPWKVCDIVSDDRCASSLSPPALLRASADASHLVYCVIAVLCPRNIHKFPILENMKILITGAAGRTSGYVIKDLLERKGVPASELRLLVRSDEAIEKVRVRFPQLGHSSFVIGDYLEASTLPHAFKDIDIVFYNGPTFTPLETAMGIAAIQAARNAGVKHYVFCSVHHPFLTKLLNHKAKLE